MADKELRRKSKRYSVRWKCAVVFDKAAGKPVLHTQTEDLSVGGAAMRCNYDDLTGSVITLLLAYPVRSSDEIPKMLKVRARVVSRAQSPAVSGFRYGLSFVRSDDDGLDILAELLGDTGAAGSGDKSSAAVQPPAAQPAVASPASSSRLAQLKQLAMAKQQEEQKPDPQAMMRENVSKALERAYRYLKDFTDQLNIVKPAYAKAYSIAGVPGFDDLVWKDGRVDARVREEAKGKRVYEQVSLNFRVFANKQLRATRETPAHEKLRQMLADTNIEFATQEERNDRGSVVRTTFVMPCEVKASLLLEGNFETGKLLLRARNVERFGMIEHVVAPESVTDESLDELTGFILGESSRVGPLLLKNA